MQTELVERGGAERFKLVCNLQSIRAVQATRGQHYIASDENKKAEACQEVPQPFNGRAESIRCVIQAGGERERPR